MKTLLTLIAVLIAVPSYAQCVAEVKDVLIDEARGSIIIETQYTVNGVVVDVKANPSPTAIGRTRYTEESGTKDEIVAKAKEDVAQHCENLIRRIEANATYRKVESLKIQKALTEPLAVEIKTDLVGYKTTKTEVVDIYKEKDIKVTYDSKNTISDNFVAVSK